MKMGHVVMKLEVLKRAGVKVIEIDSAGKISFYACFDGGCKLMFTVDKCEYDAYQNEKLSTAIKSVTGKIAYHLKGIQGTVLSC